MPTTANQGAVTASTAEQSEIARLNGRCCKSRTWGALALVGLAGYSTPIPLSVSLTPCARSSTCSRTHEQSSFCRLTSN